MFDLKTQIWLDALRWRAEAGGAAFYVIKRGDSDFGSVLLKRLRADGMALLMAPGYAMSGEKVWTFPRGDVWMVERELDQYMTRRAEDDRDLWLIEIADREGHHYLTERVEVS
ncbi:DUF1491 family protein [Woodsholea maritima]|uniref:DUF1491 family protein n=1 Tax=Woodsholea maritima TaxID=240237 RepID=UPI00037B1808|nr:DUF1491 family protein [Woodsholea maritima]